MYVNKWNIYIYVYILYMDCIKCLGWRCAYIYMYVGEYTYVYIYIYIDRQIDRQMDFIQLYLYMDYRYGYIMEICPMGSPYACSYIYI